MKKYICIVSASIAFICLFMLIGLVGSLECEMISLEQAITSGIIYSVMGIISSYICKRFDD